jgi:hypothetical protein
MFSASPYHIFWAIKHASFLGKFCIKFSYVLWFKGLSSGLPKQLSLQHLGASYCLENMVIFPITLNLEVILWVPLMQIKLINAVQVILRISEKTWEDEEG